MKIVKTLLALAGFGAAVFVLLAVLGFGQGGYNFGIGGGPEVRMLEIGRKTPPKSRAARTPRETVFDRFRALVGITPGAPGAQEAAAARFPELEALQSRTRAEAAAGRP